MWIDNLVPEEKSLGSMASNLSTQSANAVSPVSMLSTNANLDKPKLRISKIWEPSFIRDPADEMFLYGSFHPEFFLEHDGDDSPYYETSFAELEDTSSEVIPKRKGGNLRRSQTVSGMSQWRQHAAKLTRAASTSSLKSLKETTSTTETGESNTQTIELQERLHRLEAESQRLKDQNAQLSSEVQEWKDKLRPRLSLDTGSKTTSKRIEEVAGPRDRRSEGDESSMSPKVTAQEQPKTTIQTVNKPLHTPASSKKNSLEYPKPLQSNPFNPTLVPPPHQHPRPELTPPPSPESAQSPITFEISTAKVQKVQQVQQIQTISGPMDGSVKRHQVNIDGVVMDDQPIRTIPLSEARKKARVVPTFVGVTDGRRPGTADQIHGLDFGVGPAYCTGPDRRPSEQPKKKRKGSGGLFRLFRRG